jgi:hypothetical protein
MANTRIKMSGKEIKLKQDEMRMQDLVDKNLGKNKTRFLQDSPMAVPSSFEEDEYHRLRKEKNLLNFEQKYYGELGTLFNKYAHQVNKLKTSLSIQNYILQVAPIVPISVGHFKMVPHLLAVGGLKAIEVAGYLLFEDQLLLGVNFKALSKSHSGVDEYRIKCNEYKDQIQHLENKLSDVVKVEDRLDAVNERIPQVETSIIEHEKEQELVVPEAAASEAEMKSYHFQVEAAAKLLEQKNDYLETLKAEKASLIAKLSSLHEQHKPITAELDKLEAEYTLYKQTSTKVMKEGTGDFSKDIWQNLTAAVEQLNAELNTDDRLVFPETGLNFTQMALGQIPKEKRPQPVVLGDIAYYWVMKVGMLHKWHKAMDGANVAIHGWIFPHKVKSKVMVAIEKEAHQETSFIDEILKLRQLGSDKEQAFKKMSVSLIKKGKEMDDFFTKKFNKIWSEADEVLKTRTVKDVSVPREKLLSAASLLSK